MVSDTIRIVMAKPCELLRDYRQERGLSMLEMAKLLGVAESTARSLENGTRRITPDRAIEIENALGISRRELCPDLFGAIA